MSTLPACILLLPAQSAVISVTSGQAFKLLVRDISSYRCGILFAYNMHSVLLILDNISSLSCFLFVHISVIFHHFNLMIINKSNLGHVWKYSMDDIKMHACVGA